ncbi:protein spaetzle-like isoform X2 [Homalodisca vitripennis]|uniref:protein spaetzle-like isoform X2 n=1 Tax=Homalodisca vitripennis TaxID=197043 RepID=UPI001EEC15F4|nr:protein spaetzle-like isoform X2 [Homalodisca vitripennis]
MIKLLILIFVASPGLAILTEEAQITPNSSVFEEIPLCSSVQRIIYPKTAATIGFVVNDEEYRQGIKTESCVNQNSPCNIPGSLPTGYSSRCVQRFTMVTLMILNRNTTDTRSFIPKSFNFPSYCSCVLIKLTTLI